MTGRAGPGEAAAGSGVRRVRACAKAVPVAEVRAGETWLLRASGWWVDWYVPCGPAGYRNPLAALFGIAPRLPGHRFLCLVGEVGDERFAIGAGCTHRFATSGVLRVFANDAPGFYWNNWGSIALEARRLERGAPP
jgi:hypothetical protein